MNFCIFPNLQSLNRQDVRMIYLGIIYAPRKNIWRRKMYVMYLFDFYCQDPKLGFLRSSLHHFHKHHVPTVKVTVYVESEPQVLDAHV